MRDPRIKLLPDAERALVEAEIEKDWADMDSSVCSTELGRQIVKHHELRNRMYDAAMCGLI